MRLPAGVIEMAEQLMVNPCPGDPPEHLKMCNCYFGPDWDFYQCSVRLRVL